MLYCDFSLRFGNALEGDVISVLGQVLGNHFAPLCRDDAGTLKIFVKARGIKVVAVRDSVHIEMIDVEISDILVYKGKGRACDSHIGAQHGGKTSYKVGFSHSETAEKGNKIA